MQKKSAGSENLIAVEGRTNDGSAKIWGQSVVWLLRNFKNRILGGWLSLAFLLRVIPNMVRWEYEGAWEPSSILVWVLTWFGLWQNRFELHMLLRSNCVIITRPAFLIE